MRLALTMPFLALTIATPCFAQSDDFNPYQAVLDGMSLEQAEPLIEAAYGPIGDRLAGVATPYDDGPVQILMLQSAGTPFFLFCEGRLAAFSGPITPAQAATILRPLTSAGADNIAYPDENGVWFQTADELLSIDYTGVGTKTSMVMLTYPQEVMLNFNFDKRCAEVAD